MVLWLPGNFIFSSGTPQYDYLKMFSLNRVSVVRLLLAAAGGLLLSAAFPGVGLAGAAWVAPGLILFSALGCGGGQAFRLGFVGGFAHFLSSLYWLLALPDTFHGIPIGPAAGWLALSAYCALFPALWVWLCWRIWPAPPGAPAQGTEGTEGTEGTQGRNWPSPPPPAAANPLRPTRRAPGFASGRAGRSPAPPTSKPPGMKPRKLP